MSAGSAYNQAGRSSGLTAPNGPAQTALVRTALRAAALRPQDLAFVSMHGTGTPLGDPIEVGALGQALAGTPKHPSRATLGETADTSVDASMQGPCMNETGLSSQDMMGLEGCHPVHKGFL